MCYRMWWRWWCATLTYTLRPLFVSLIRPGILQHLLWTPIHEFDIIVHDRARQSPLSDLDADHRKLAILVIDEIPVRVELGKDLEAVVAALQRASSLGPVVVRKLFVERVDNVVPLKALVLTHVLNEVHFF